MGSVIVAATPLLSPHLAFLQRQAVVLPAAASDNGAMTEQTDFSDPLPLAQALMRCRSVTPADDGALDTLGAALEMLGFQVQRHRFGEVDNLYAKRGAGGRNFCFAGHVDVVPPGNGWRNDPFDPQVRDGWLIGRGAADMKAAIAAMVTAAARVRPDAGVISFLITGDEEGPAVNGTVKLLEAITAAGETLDACLVGEPTSVDALGDTIKNGRRGSLNAVVRVRGKQGHVAYPALALNPLGPLLDFLAMLRHRMLDSGAPGFDASNLEVTTVDVGNGAHNVIPAAATAKFNIRFNTHHSGASLVEWIETCRARCARLYPAAEILVETRVTGEPFFTPPGDLTALAAAAAQQAGAAGALSTSGGTSDARFIRAYCPVVELGLQNATAHMVDERVRVEDVRTLADIYTDLLTRYFSP
jgi:succinyl-diaminopimelate desuccinylase